MITGIYQITNTVNGKCYVGSAVRFHSRWRLHRTQLNNGKHHSKVLQRAWDKYGEASFEFRKLLVCAKTDLLWFEQRAMDVLKPEYNICKVAGSVIGYRHTEKAKEDARVRATGNTLRRGKKISGEAKKRISEARKGKGVGRVFSEETKAKISAAHKGRTISEERKEHLRRVNTGKKQSSETIEKRMKQLRGRTRTPEAIEKTRQALKGRKHTDAARLANSRAKTKLSEEDVRDIRRRAAEGEPQATIGKDYGLTQSGICSIHKRKTHKQVI